MKRRLLLVLAFGLVFLFSLCLITGIWLYISSLPDEEEAATDWSPDGQYLVFECYLAGPTEPIAENIKRHYVEEAADICTIGSDGHNRSHLTKAEGADRHPTWSPDGTQIAYVRHDGIYVINADGSNQRRLLLITNQQSASEIGKVIWSPDGSHLLFSSCLPSSSERDIYSVEVNSGNLTNLTPNSGLQGIEPRWILNGTKIVFLSTTSTLMPASCLFGLDVSFQVRVINADGREERTISNKVLFYRDIIASNAGQIGFISDEGSKTASEYLAGNWDKYLYIMSLDQEEPIKQVKTNGPISWSPNGKYLVYDSSVLEVETGKIHSLPSVNPIINGIPTIYYVIDRVDTWSPDNQQIAVTVSEDKGFYAERHIYVLNLQEGTVRSLIQN